MRKHDVIWFYWFLILGILAQFRHFRHLFVEDLL